MNTHDPTYSPHSLLPAPEPRHDRPATDYFYENVAKHLIKDVIKLMNNGIHIDLDKVSELEDVLVGVLQTVEDRLESNVLIYDYQKTRHKRIVQEYIEERSTMLRQPDYYMKPFKSKDMTHRSYYMYIFCRSYELEPPEELLLTGVPKWTAKQVKAASATYKALERLLNDSVSKTSKVAVGAMELLAEHKAALYNVKFENQIRTVQPDFRVTYDPEVPEHVHILSSVSSIEEAEEVLTKKRVVEALELPKFNPASPDQKHEFFTGMLGLESDAFTDSFKDYERNYRYIKRFKGQGAADALPRPKNKYSWDRDNIERVNKESSDPVLIDATQAMIDHSFGAIVKNNFIEAFYNYTVDGRLHGSYKLYGTKTFRLTSNKPNLLNMPSSNSIYAKPIKRCFTAPEGKVILAIDYGALEDRVIASLSRDPNKCDIFNSGLDGHCLNSYYYFKEEIAEHMTLTGDTTTDVREYHRLVESGHKELKAIRQRGKAPSFGMQYGAYPPKIQSSIKCTLEEAESIFNRYHNELYPGVTTFREEYVTPTVECDHKIHMGLGSYLLTDAPGRDIRTLTNS